MTSGYQGWGFTADTLASLNARVNGVEPADTLRRLRRDPKRWVCDLGLRPVLQLMKAVDSGEPRARDAVHSRLVAVGGRPLQVDDWELDK